MPREITSDAKFVDKLAVPRDGEAIDAKDVAIPFQELLGNDLTNYGLIATLREEFEAYKRAGGGFVLSPPAALTLEPSRTYVLTDAVGIGRAPGYTQAVTLQALGLPVGVTAAFNPSPATGASSTLTLTVAANAIPGGYDVTLRGTAPDGKFSEAILKLTISAETAASAFDIYATNAISVGQDAGTKTATTNVSIERQGGFSTPITFSLQGLPAGITPTFTPNPATGNSAFTQVGTALTLTATGTATPAGAYSLTLRAEGGGIVRTAAIALYVASPAAVTPDFDLAVVYDAGDPLLINGATLQITRRNGYTGPVTLGLQPGNLTEYAAGPRVLINGQPGQVTVAGNTARLTADGVSNGWTNAGVAPVAASAASQFRRITVTGTGATGETTATRYADVTYRTGTRRY